MKKTNKKKYLQIAILIFAGVLFPFSFIYAFLSPCSLILKITNIGVFLYFSCWFIAFFLDIKNRKGGDNDE